MRKFPNLQYPAIYVCYTHHFMSASLLYMFEHVSLLLSLVHVYSRYLHGLSRAVYPQSITNGLLLAVAMRKKN